MKLKKNSQASKKEIINKKVNELPLFLYMTVFLCIKLPFLSLALPVQHQSGNNQS